MPPFIATLLWFIFLVALFRFDPAKEPGTSLALWAPLLWMFINGSRLPSQWLGGQVQTANQALEEGSPLDRVVFLLLILLALGVLMTRSFKWGEFFARNIILMTFLFFALVSVTWSDFPFVSFKRWFRDLGDYLVILVVLSDPRPLEALRTLLRRLCYLLIPLSILLIKYYPYMGKLYSEWTGTAMFVGATTSKNMLGVVCLISGIFFFWDTLTRWSDRKERRTKRIIILNVAFIGMTLWLLNLAESATSRVCLLLGCLVVAAAHSRKMKRNPNFLKAAIPISLILYTVLELGFGISGQVAEAVGRNPTLTGRTELWGILLGMHTNPLIGTGYESFWLGPRLQWIWQRFAVVNESHNGYLEVYLNLGFIGLLLLGGFLITSYRNICRRLATPSTFASASLVLALWTLLLFYNVTEAAFKSQLIWLVFRLGAIAVSGRAEDPVLRVAAFDSVGVAKQFPNTPLDTTGLRR
jgi:exopolysaccharide production protein ExoQ